MNVSTAEAWLEDMLELIEIEGGVAARGMEGAHGLRRARIDRRELAAAGLSPAQVARLYLSLFVHSFGAHQAIESALRGCSAVSRATLGVRVLTVLVAVSERLIRTSMHSELVEMMHALEDELSEVEKHANARVDEAEARVRELTRTVAAALREADAAALSRAEESARRLALSAELPVRAFARARARARARMPSPYAEPEPEPACRA